MKKFIIAKYAEQYFPNGKAPSYASVFRSHTANEVGMEKESFSSKEEAELWLERLTSFNPTVDYGVVEVDESYADTDPSSVTEDDEEIILEKTYNKIYSDGVKNAKSEYKESS